MIHTGMQLLEIVEKYPETEAVLHSYDTLANSCILCEHLFDTLGDLAQLCQVNAEDMLRNLNSKINTAEPENMERMARP